MMRRYAVVLLILLLIPGLTGCWGARELNALSLVMGIGIDKKASDPDKVFMTAQIVRPEALKKAGTGDSGGQSTAFWNLESIGTSVFDAVREYTHETHNKLYIAHSEIILFGKDAAADGVRKYLDFFQRAQETRPTMDIAVSATTASDAFQVMPELDKLPAVNITKLVQSQEFTSQSREVTLEEFTNALISKTKCPIAPMVWTTTQENGKQLTVVKGLAVFKDDKMIGQLDENETRGLLWVESKVKSGVIDLEYLSGLVTIEINKGTAKVNPKVADGKVIIHVDVNTEGVMAAQTCAENLETPFHMTVLENLEQEAIRQEILNTINKTKQMNTDIYGFGEELHKHNPSQWSSMENDWDRIYPTIQVEVTVQCKLRSAGNISKPSRPE